MHRLGQELYKSLLCAIETEESHFQAATERFASLDEMLRDRLFKRAELYSELARMYLPRLEAEALSLQLDCCRSVVEQILEERALTQRELTARRAAGDEARGRIAQELDALGVQLTDCAAQRDALQGEVAAALSDDTTHKELKREIEKLASELVRDERRLVALKAEAAEKLPAFEAEPLFIYLYDRKYGEDSYQCRWPINKLDRFVASRFDYPLARKHYNFLKSSPALVALSLSEEREKLKNCLNKLHKMEKTHANAVGLSEVLERGRVLGATREELLRQLSSLEQSRLEISAELASIDSSSGPYYEKAIEAAVSSLENTSFQELEEKAKATASQRDDELLIEIKRTQAEIAEHRRSADNLSQQAQTSQRTLAVLGAVKTLFLQHDFDSARSRFTNAISIDKLVAGIRAGKYDEAKVWDKIRSKQSFIPFSNARQSSSLNEPEMIEFFESAARAFSRHHRNNHTRKAPKSVWWDIAGLIFRNSQKNSGSFTSGDGF